MAHTLARTQAGAAAAGSPEPLDELWVQRLQTINLSGAVVMPTKLHNRKHVSESIIQHKTFMRNFFCPLFLKILPYAKSKYSEIKKRLEGEYEEALRAMREADEQAAAAEAGSPEELTALTAREDADTVAQLAHVALELNDDLGNVLCPLEGCEDPDDVPEDDSEEQVAIERLSLDGLGEAVARAAEDMSEEELDTRAVDL